MNKEKKELSLEQVLTDEYLQKNWFTTKNELILCRKHSCNACKFTTLELGCPIARQSPPNAYYKRTKKNFPEYFI